MNDDDVMIPDFSSVLSGGDESKSNYEVRPQKVVHETETSDAQDSIKVTDTVENSRRLESEPEEELLDESEADTPSVDGPTDRPLARPDSMSESDIEDDYGSEIESESELSESEFPESSSESDTDSDEDCSDDDSSTSSYESSRASTEIDVAECGAEEGDAEHVYEEEGEADEEQEEEGEGDIEVCYEDTDLGGENADTASLIAASILAGGGAVRSTGWTWTSIFIVLSAAGGIGIVLLYAIKRINELTRLVKTLEENSHMAINERDVQVITTQVIGDMLDDSDNSRIPYVETPDDVKTEIECNDFESVNRQQRDDSNESDNDGDCVEEESISNTDADATKEDDDVQVAQDVSEKKEEEVEENATPVPAELVAIVEKKQCSIADASNRTENLSVAVEEEQGVPTIEKPEEMGQETGKDKSDPVVDDLVTMVQTMSLSKDIVETKEPSRLITGTKRVRSA